MGDTILHYAAYHSLKKLIEYLLEKGADPYYLNNVVFMISSVV
jgi:ankyrin repeat protein